MTLIEPTIDNVTDERTAEGDHDQFTHIVVVEKGAPFRAQDVVMFSRIEGIPIQALCGKQWIPQRDPERFEVCPSCIEEWERLSGKKWSER